MLEMIVKVDSSRSMPFGYFMTNLGILQFSYVCTVYFRIQDFRVYWFSVILCFAFHKMLRNLSPEEDYEA